MSDVVSLLDGRFSFESSGLARDLVADWATTSGNPKRFNEDALRWFYEWSDWSVGPRVECALYRLDESDPDAVIRLWFELERPGDWDMPDTGEPVISQLLGEVARPLGELWESEALKVLCGLEDFPRA